MSVNHFDCRLSPPASPLRARCLWSAPSLASGSSLMQPPGDHHDQSYLDEDLDGDGHQGGVRRPPGWRGASPLCQVLPGRESPCSWVERQRHLHLPGWTLIISPVSSLSSPSRELLALYRLNLPLFGPRNNCEDICKTMF